VACVKVSIVVVATESHVDDMEWLTFVYQLRLSRRYVHQCFRGIYLVNLVSLANLVELPF